MSAFNHALLTREIKANGRHRLRGRDVIPWLPLRQVAQFKKIRYLIRWLSKCKSTTHDNLLRFHRGYTQGFFQRSDALANLGYGVIAQGNRPVFRCKFLQLLGGRLFHHQVG